MTNALSISDSIPKSVFKELTFGKNSLFDVFFVILGGLPLYIVLLWGVGEKTMAQNIPFDYAFWANQIVSMPHVWATYFRLSRKISEGKINYLMGLPAYIAIVATLIAATVYGFFLVAMTAVNVWQTYHYLRQTYGVSRFFARPSGETEQEKNLSFWAYHLGVPIFVLGRWNMLYVFWHGKPSDAIIPVGFPAPLLYALGVLAFVGIGMGLFNEVLKYRRAHKSFDCSGLLNLITYYVIHWYGFISPENYMVGFVAVTIFHAVQYLAISWRLEERQITTDLAIYRTFKFLPTALSFCLFWGILYVVGDLFTEHIFKIGNVFMPVFASICLSSVSAHHYLVDTMLWGRKAGI